MGKIKSKVLAATNGVITEERYQKLTLAQWLWQYKVIMKEEKRQNENLIVLTDYIKLVGVMANPKLGSELISQEKIEKAKEDINSDNFAEIYNSLNAPEILEVKLETKNDGIILPTYKRKKGIVKGGE